VEENPLQPNTFSPALAGFFSNLKGYTNHIAPVSPDEEVISINLLTGKAGTFYEKIRYLLDNKDEHMIQRSAIARILKRRIMIERKNDVGMPLLRELITGGYLPNKAIPERIAGDVQKIVDRYLVLQHGLSTFPKEAETLIGYMANEVGRLLFPVDRDEALLGAFYESIRPRVDTGLSLTHDELDTLIYTACRRALFREDNESIAYTLWLHFSGWNSLMTAEEIQKLASVVPAIEHHIKETLKHPLGWELVPRIKNDSIYFSVLQELVHTYDKETENVLKEKENLRESIKSLLAQRYVKDAAKTNQGAIRAIIYVFATKILLALLVELPYEIYIIGAIHYFPLAVNIIFHPILLFFMTQIGVPGAKNTELIIEGVWDTLHGENLRPIKIKKGAGGSLPIIFSILYLVLFSISFSILIFILLKLTFNVANILLFLTFLTLVSYLGLRIRHNAKRWQIKTSEERISALLWNIFTLPIVKAGRWLSQTFSSINVFVFVMDFLVEAPFKLFLSIGDAFTSFLREKQEETI
jgi:hypothetical protein